MNIPAASGANKAASMLASDWSSMNIPVVSGAN